MLAVIIVESNFSIEFVVLLTHFVVVKPSEKFCQQRKKLRLLNSRIKLRQIDFSESFAGFGARSRDTSIVPKQQTLICC